MLSLIATIHSSSNTPNSSPRWCRSPWRHGACGLPATKSNVTTTSTCDTRHRAPGSPPPSPATSGATSGSWRRVADAAACARLCRGCDACKYISYSPLDSACSWFARCDTLVLIKATYRSKARRVVVNQTSRAKKITDRRHCTLAAADFEVAYPPTWSSSQELMQARGVISLGSRQNAKALLRMVRDPERSNQTSVLGIGSSVTQYGGGGRGHCVAFPWRSCGQDGFLVQAARALQVRAINVYNAGRQGGSMDHFADCYKTYSPPETRLVVIELTISPSPRATPLERLLRLLLLVREPPTVVLLRPIHTWWRDNAQAGECNHALLRSLAAHYGVAYVDEFSLLTHSENSSDTYTFANLADKSSDLHPAALLVDSVHPTARGARLLGSVLERALRSMLRASEDGNLPSLPSLPMPLSGEGGGGKYSHQCYEFRDPAADAVSRETSHTWSLSNARPTVPISSDPYSRWEYVLDTSKFGAQRPGLASTVPGSHVTFAPLDTRPHNNVNATPIVQVEYLSSYDRQMGSAQLQCLSGCACRTTLLQGRSTSRMSVPVARAVAVSASAQCVMRVTLLDSGERASDGAHHVGKHDAAGSRFKLTGLRIGSEAATKESGPRETPAALKTLQQDAPARL